LFVSHLFSYLFLADKYINIASASRRMNFKEEIVKALKKEVDVDIQLEVPPSRDLGHYAFPCFTLAKQLKKAPAQIAQELAEKLSIDGVTEITATGPYVNFKLDSKILAESILTEVFENDHYGTDNSGVGKHALIEHTSINPNASPHVGRARNAIIGDAITRILRFAGYDVDVRYFVNDIGKQIGMLVLGSRGKEPTFQELLDIYVEFNNQLKEKPKLEEDVFELLKQLEEGDEGVRQEFLDVVETCVKGQQAIFSDLGIEYDSFDYESDYLFNKKTDSVLEELDKTGKLFKDEEGRFVLDLKGVKEVETAMKVPVLVLTRNDGTSLYPLRDLAYSKDKADWAKNRNIIVLGEDQKLYFNQLAAALKMLNVQAPEVIHYSFVGLAEGKMATRTGTVVLLEDFMKEAVKKAAAEVKNRENISEDELESLSKVIGHGAIKFSILKVSGDKNVTFDWGQALNFEGASAPYVQYAHARINSILEKHGGKRKAPDFKLLVEAHEQALITRIASFKEVISQATTSLAPHLMVNYVIELAQDFTSFYHACPVLNAESKELVQARLALCEATKKVLATALNLVGIDAPEKM
jgi:arginyl-tRNA synthetase